MRELDKVFTGSIPDIYDAYLVPLIFEQYADDLAGRAAALSPDDVLEVAAGSGVVTRAATAALPAGTRYVATDLNPPMLQRAAAVQADREKVEWLPANAMALPFEDSDFDAVLCQFGVMFFPDRVKAYSEARRVLRPGGSFIFNMWDRIEENEFADVVTGSLAQTFPADPPRFLVRTPHGHYDHQVFESELANAGFEHISIEPLNAISRASGPVMPAVAYCQGTPLRNEIEAFEEPSLEEATAGAARAIAERFGSGEVEGQIRAFVITAR